MLYQLKSKELFKEVQEAIFEMQNASFFSLRVHLQCKCKAFD